VAQSLSPIGERLGVSQPKGPRIPTARLNPAHAAKAMHSNVMFADRLKARRQERLFLLVVTMPRHWNAGPASHEGL
jgi:hypothetical protein